MSLDFTYDYSNHTLLDNSHKYTKLYKLVPVEASSILKGDTLLLQTSCGDYGMFISIDNPSPDGTLHLSKLLEFDFTKVEE